MLFSFSKRCTALSFIIFVCNSAIVMGKSKEKSVTGAIPKEMQEELAHDSTLLGVTDAIPSDIEKSSKEETDELPNLSKEAESKGDVDTEKELEKIAEVITEVSADIEKIFEEIDTESPKEEIKEPGEESITGAEETLHKAEASTSVLEMTVPEEKNGVKTSALPMLATLTNNEKEEAPKDTFAVWNSKGKICLLAKFHAAFTISYASKGGEQKLEISVPHNGNAKGKCETTSRSPMLEISWQKYVFSMMFNKSEDEENWVVTSMELTYDTSDPLFDGATSAGKKTARSKALSYFETPVKMSHFCPAQEVVLLYTGKKQDVTGRLKEVYLQPYEVENAKFSSAHRCNKVVLDGPDESPFVQDETVPLAVGCTLALITLCILVGFSVHRAYNAAKVDYNTME